MRAIFIRHGQSTGNAGIPCNDLSLLELTELGWWQSREVAASWTEKPDLIVTSPYLRTQQATAATMARFQNVPVKVWPIQEFTYLQPSRWNGTLSSERMLYLGSSYGPPGHRRGVWPAHRRSIRRAHGGSRIGP